MGLQAQEVRRAHYSATQDPVRSAPAIAIPERFGRMLDAIELKQRFSRRTSIDLDHGEW